MKKFSCILCVLLVCVLLAGCFGGDAPNDANEDSDVTDGGTPDIQTAAHIEVYEQENANIEFVEVTGWHDYDVQTALNEELMLFFTWPLYSVESAEQNITTSAQFSIIGNKYISVIAYDSIYIDGAPYPMNTVRAATFDLETGENAGGMSDFVVSIEGLITALEFGNFEQIYPSSPIDDAVDILIDALIQNPNDDEVGFYLREESFGIFLTNRRQAEGVFWLFEAPFSSIESLLSERLLAVIR